MYPPAQPCTIRAAAPGYFSADQSDETGEWFSAARITNSLFTGTNVLSNPLKLVPAMPAIEIYSISGTVRGIDGTSTNGLPGVSVHLEYESGEEEDGGDQDDPQVSAWAITDTSGAFSLPAPAGMPALVFAADQDLTINGWMGNGSMLVVSQTMASVELTCVRPDTLLIGDITGSDAQPVPGINVLLNTEEPPGIAAAAYSMTNGLYEMGVRGNLDYEQEIFEYELRAQNYLSMEEQTVNIPSGQLVFTNTPLAPKKGVLLSGRVYDSTTNALSDGSVAASILEHLQWLDPCTTDHSGKYVLLLTTGTWRVATETNSFLGYSQGVSNGIALPSHGLDNVDFFLQRAAIISGSVTAKQDAVLSRVEAMRITNTSPRGTEFAAAANITNGTYSLEVASGYDYIVSIKPDTNSYYAEAYYNGKETYETADVVSPTAQTPATNINFVLTQGMRVSGSVSNSSGAPLSDILITPFIRVTGEWTHAESARTDGSGNFSFVTGSTNGIIVCADLFDPQSGTLGKMYYNQVLSPDMATLLDFAAGTTRSNIDFQLFEAGSLQVHLDYNPGTMLESSRWRLKNSTYETNWFTSDHRIENLPVGTYTTEYSSIDGWDTPPEQTAVLTNNASVQITATYTQQVGSLMTYLTPDGAKTAGAQWRLTSGSETNWHSSGSSINPLAVSSYTQTFKAVDGWYTPADQLIVITKDQSTVNTGTYTEITYGNLQVTLLPADVTNAAQWRITSSSNWYSSAYTLTNIVTGTYTAECSRISGWRAPGSIAVSITDGQTTQTTLTYKVLSGSLGALMLLLQE